MTAFSRTASYKARRIDITVDDIVRAVGPREPEVDVRPRRTCAWRWCC